MWTLWPQLSAHKGTERSMTPGAAAAPHLRSTTGQQNSQELPHTPATAQLLQQPPGAPHRTLSPSYPAGFYPHFKPVPSVSHTPAECSTPAPDHGPQQRSLQANLEMGMLQLLAHSDPVLSADELLARLRPAATAEAPAHHAGIQGHQCIANMHQGAGIALGPHHTVFAAGPTQDDALASCHSYIHAPAPLPPLHTAI